MENKNSENKYTVVRTEEEWKKILSRNNIAFCAKGTEHPFSGEFDHFLEMESIIVPGADNNYFYRIRNLIPVAGGRLLIKKWKKA